MTLTLIRNEFSENGIFGKLEGEGLLLETLEHSFDGQSKIPVGNFNCRRGIHRLHNGVDFETFEIEGVVGHTGILFHSGNRNEDSNGCVLLGLRREGDSILESRAAFELFLELTADIAEFDLSVK